MQECFLSKNELLLLMDEHFPELHITLADNPAHSKVFSSLGQDVTEQYMAFVQELLWLNGVKASYA
jgi:hypothetical protein